VYLELGTMPLGERRKRCSVTTRRRGDQLLVEPD
jgi:hypothetical protein